MKVSKVKSYIFSLLMPVVAVEISAEESLHYDLSMTGGAGAGTFAPYYMSSLRHGRFTQSENLQMEVAVWKDMDLSRRFSYGFGVDVVSGLTSSTSYQRYDGGLKEWYSHSERPSAIWLQQLYGELKYRGVFLEVGLKEQKSAFLNQELTSGDLVESGNTRPMPQMRAGFWDFQDIPFTNGWLQISGEAAFGFMLDDGWWRDHYNYYNRHITTHQLYNYKRAYFRTKPSKPFSALFGMQAAATFGGTTIWYTEGKAGKRMTHPRTLRYFLKMIFPMEDGGEGFYSGNHLGSWDLRFRYRFRNESEVALYTSWLWDDGSGIGKLNGFDGLWGAEYKAARKGYVNGVVVEYFDFTNQSGPIHYNPGDYPGSTLPGHVSGADDYYNNATYNAYSYFGLALGTPVMMAPLYNRDGYAYFVGTAVRGFHVGVAGAMSSTVDYRLKGGYRKAWGTPFAMLKDPLHLSSVMLEATWHSPTIKGLHVNGRFEVDRGNMPCNAAGLMVGVKYEGSLNLKH